MFMVSWSFWMMCILRAPHEVNKVGPDRQFKTKFEDNSGSVKTKLVGKILPNQLRPGAHEKAKTHTKYNDAG